jgi:hypothetical protein
MGYRIAANSPDINAEGTGAIANLDKAFGYEVDTTAGAIGIKEGNEFINGGSALAMTLAQPIAGEQSAGGDDGRVLRIISVTAFAHTVTTGASPGLMPSHHILTFAGAAGDFIELIAWDGLWIVGASVGVTPS